MVASGRTGVGVQVVVSKELFFLVLMDVSRRGDCLGGFLMGSDSRQSTVAHLLDSF